MEPIINRVAESDIDVYDLAALWDGAGIAELDLEPFLVEGLILREKEFRQHVKAHAWDAYQGQHVAIFCSTDAIIPTWAYMLVASKLDGVARSVTHGRRADVLRDFYVRALDAEDWSRYQDRIVVVKGCGSQLVPPSAYIGAMHKLQGVARKLMYGEPCSSVPLWRKPKAAGAPRPAATTKPALPSS